MAEPKIKKMNPKLLFCDTHPFGKLTDLYQWCYYLKNSYDIRVICFDEEKPKSLDGIDIKRVNYIRNKTIRGFVFLFVCLWNIITYGGHVWIVYFEFCSLLKRILFFKKMHVDIRTVSISPNASARKQYDNRMRYECSLFDSVSVISEGVRDKLGLINAQILPLGADVISHSKKNYFPIRLLYVGTFDYRHLDDTIRGLSLLLQKHPDFDIHYEMVGGDHHGEVDICRALVKELRIDDYVTIHGRIDYQLLQPLFDKSNVGVSYVPITSFYNIQPPTKIFEYTMSGLYCIATDTYESRKLISSSNGILIKDTAADFCNAIEYFAFHYNSIKESDIRKSLSRYTWDKIIQDYMIPLI